MRHHTITMVRSAWRFKRSVDHIGYRFLFLKHLNFLFYSFSDLCTAHLRTAFKTPDSVIKLNNHEHR